MLCLQLRLQGGYKIEESWCPKLGETISCETILIGMVIIFGESRFNDAPFRQAHSSKKSTTWWSLQFSGIHKWRESGCHHGKIANTTVPTRSWCIFLSQPPDMQKAPMGRFIYISISSSFTDHDQLRTNVGWRSWLARQFDNDTSCFKSLSRSKASEAYRPATQGRRWGQLILKTQLLASSSWKGPLTQ